MNTKAIVGSFIFGFILLVTALAGLFLLVRDRPLTLFFLVPLLVAFFWFHVSKTRSIRRQMLLWQDSFWRQARCPSCGRAFGARVAVFPPNSSGEMVPDLGFATVVCPTCKEMAMYDYDSPHELRPFPTRKDDA